MTWRPVGGITPPGGFTDCGVIIDSNDANDVFVQLMCQCSPGNMPPSNQMLWRSRDGGASWRRLTMPQLPLGWVNIVVIGSRIVGLSSDDSPLHNHPPLPVCTTDPKATDLHQINDLYASDEGGMTWKHIGQPLIDQGLSIIPGGQEDGSGGFGIGDRPNFSVASVGTTLFVRTYCDVKQRSGIGPTQQTYWRSSDGGETWTKLPVPNSDLFFTLAATGGAYGVAVNPGLNGDYALPPVLLYSRDSGASWTTLPSLGSIPLPPHFRPSAAGCVNTCHTHYGTPLAIALPDGMVLAVLTVDDVINNTLVYVSNVYAIDPQSPHPAWHLFAPGYVGSGRMTIVDDWPLAATKQGLVLWALTTYLENGKSVPQRIYLAPLP